MRSGAPASVSIRARILIGESYALVTATTTRTFDLAAGQQVYLPELLRAPSPVPAATDSATCTTSPSSSK